MIIVGLSGKARTGKSELTRRLYDAAQAVGWTVKVLPFAGPLKKEAEDSGFGKNTNPEKYRAFCQEHGAKMRAENPDHWVNKWFEQVKSLRAEEENMTNPLLVLVDDCRYQNEIAILNKHSGVVCYVKHGDREIDDPKGEWRQHESELIANILENTPDDDIKKQGYDYVIYNDGDVDKLDNWAATFISKVCIAEDCPCESCTSTIENRQADSAKIDDELRRLLDDIEDNLDD